ncbi:MAG: ATP-binding cassette domain-containing protein [Lachnospiraceae bacterium]|nr:ATP-binding cassette domain-containing protein [Lachnospiraceae bacterium]
MGLIVRDLSKKYGDKTVVDHISFEMDKPGVYALLGTNGAGKTTTIRMILDMLDKNTGEVLWNDRPLSFETCNIGYLAEERGLYLKYPLMDQIKYFGRLRDVPEDELDEKIRYWSDRLKLDEYLYPTASEDKKGRKKKVKPKSPDQLSKGNQQKIQFLIAMLSDPELIVLDEPFSGLDPVNTDILKNVVREQIEAGKFIIMSSHQMAVVEEFCTDITILSKAKAVVKGNLNEIKKGYGRVNLNLKCEQDCRSIIDKMGITVLTDKECEYSLKVTGDAQANELLAKLVENKINVIKFDLSELSLHEIFVKEVGADE